MGYREQTTVSIIRDNGERRSLRLSRRLFLALIVFFVLLVPVCGLALWQVVALWQENSSLQTRLEDSETALATALATTRRLQHLDVLLNEAGLDGREYVLRKLGTHTADNGKQLAAAGPAVPEQPVPPATGQQTGGAPAPENSENAHGTDRENGGDGDNFQGVDLGYVRVSNVTVRLVQQRRLRIALDLYNSRKQEVASGTVEAILLTADGERTNLEYTVEDAGNFRISSFKRAVMLSRLPSRFNLANAQILVEIRNLEHTLVFSNLYPVAQ